MAWKGNYFAKLTLWINHLIVEGNSTTVVAWLQEHPDCGMVTHPLVYDNRYFLLRCDAYDIRYIYHEMNSVADWITSFVAYHFSRSFYFV